MSLALAHQLEWNNLIFCEDRRYDYGEERMIGYAPIDQRVYCVVYTWREQYCRVISLRKANTREVDYYESVYSQQK